MTPLTDVSNSAAPPKRKSIKKKRKSKEVLSTGAKILDRLTQAVDDAPPSMNRSPELVPLTMEWEATKKKLRWTVSVAKEYAETTRAMHESRSKLVSQLVLLSENSPIFDSIGEHTLNGKSMRALQSMREEPPVGKRTTINQIIKSSDESANSLGSLHEMAATQGIIQERDFRTQVIDYAIEWEKAVSEKVESELKKVRTLQATRAHYEKKLEKLRLCAEDLEKKGKKEPSNQDDKLERNEAKLMEAFESHEKEAGRLCVLLEEATTNGWRDLYHLVKYYCKWESYRVEQESDIYSRLLPTTLESMKATFNEYPFLLSTDEEETKENTTLGSLC
eukprot:CAMPEP_0168182420 /NCGR_PEP_ID=MMETSP0139_2-20121125/11885_1 /TAXON_ID=44445 /ORGANISM="Pseudo-nitzschia australis, Strain 10249 10 AB" /LENGTH=333 /DNA_ID=CAMNT_0008103351 /DNA_START=41 /DNA_END=1042 /DNA_ORIENTATION=+